MSARAQMAQNIGAMLDGTISDMGAVTILQQIEEHGATAEQIAGAVDAVMARVVDFPSYSDAIDCCGTGGDYQHHLNISTAVAIVVAACDVKVAKHGNRAVTSKSGSADVLKALGVNTNLSAEATAKCMDAVGLCFLFAPSFHPGFARVSALRKAIGHRTIFNLLGPLSNPAKVERQLIGVYDKALCEPMIQAAKLLGRKHVMVVHGGGDEISISEPTTVCELLEGQITQYELQPKQAGLVFRPAAELAGGDAIENAKAMLAILEGDENTYADAVVFNAAVALTIASAAGGLRGGATMARHALASGDARRKLEHLIVTSQTV